MSKGIGSPTASAGISVAPPSSGGGKGSAMAGIASALKGASPVKTGK